jgi:hypothetical protein
MGLNDGWWLEEDNMGGSMDGLMDGCPEVQL